MFDCKKTHQYLFFVILILGVVNCSNKATQGVPDFDEICQIYKNIVNQPISDDKKYIMIVEQINKEFLVFFNKDFINVLQSDPEQRYLLLKQVSERDGIGAWKCKAIYFYYKN